MATLYKQLDAIDMLLENGADVNLKDVNGRTAEDVARGIGLDQKVVAKLK